MNKVYLFLLTPLLLLTYTLGAQSLIPQGCLTLDIGTAQGNVGETVCVDVTVKDFDNILGLQYTTRFDPDALTFVEATNFGASGLTAINFGTSTALLNNGLLPLSWYPNNLVAVSLPDDAVLYSVCFTIDAPTDEPIYFFNNPTTIEIVNGNEELLAANLLSGGVHTATTAASLNAEACAVHTGCSATGNGSVALSVSGGLPPYTYAWSNGATTATVNGLSEAEYVVTITDQAGVERIERFFITDETGDYIAAVSTTDASCDGNADGAITVSYFGALSDYTFSWSNGATSSSLADVPAGTYTLELTHLPSECVSTHSYTIAEASSFGVLSIITPASCVDANSGAINIIPGGNWNGNLSFAWSTGATTEDIDQLSPGVYSVTVTDEVGCSVVEQVVIYQEAELNLRYEVTPPNCYGDLGSIGLILPNITTNYSIIWDNGATTPTITDLVPGDYSVTVSDNNSACLYTNTITVRTDEIIVGYDWECQAFLDTSIVTVSALVWGGGVPPYTFTWSDGTTQTDPSISRITGDGTAIYSVTITDSIGCSVVNELIDPDCDPSDNPTPAALGLYILPTSVAPEERVCLPVKTTNFSDIESFQFSLSWNPAIASNASIQNIGLPWLGANNFNITTPGTLSVNWMDILGPDDIAFLPNGATLFELCLDANATGGASEIAFGDQPLAIQAVNGAGTILEVNTSNGYLEVVNTNGSPVTINVPDVSVEPNQEVCLSVQADNFFDVVGAQFTITFDPTLVEYTGVVPLTLSTVTDNNFGTSSDNLANGTLPFSWYDPSLSGVSLPTGSTLFDVCFTAIANGGTSVIGIESDPVTVEFVKQGLSVLPYLVNDGSISIESTDEATQAVLRIGSTEGETGQLRCVDITAEQIEDLISMQFSIAWDPSVLDLETIFTDNGLPGFTSNNFGLNFVEQGQLAVAWFNPSLEPVTLDQGTELFELCFNLIGPSGSSSAINFAQTPTAIEFVNSNTNTMSFSGIEGTIAIVENVWPGDTDNNEQVDHFDLLNIGLGFNATGPARATSSTDWTGFAAADWPQFTPSTGTNYRHIDANGDGVINSTDIVGIAFNWGETTNFWDGGAQENNFTQSVLDNVPLYVQSDTILPNTNVSFDIILGEENFQAEDIYGIAFSVYYDASVVVPGSASFDFTQSWLAGSNNHILNIARDFYQAGRIDMAIVRTDQNNVSGFGKIGAFSLTIEDVIFRNAEYEMFFTIDNVRLINNNEVELPITPRSTTALIDLITSTEQADLTSQIDIYPNPTADQLSVVGKDLTIEQIRLFDYTGKELPLPLTDPSVLSLSGLPGGIYMLQVTTDKGVLVERIVKTNH